MKEKKSDVTDKLYSDLISLYKKRQKEVKKNGIVFFLLMNYSLIDGKKQIF